MTGTEPQEGPRPDRSDTPPPAPAGRGPRCARALCTAALLLVLAGPRATAAEPRATAAWSTNPCPPGKPLTLTVSVRWVGDARAYRVRPPRIEFPEPLAAHPAGSRTSGEGNEHVVVHVWGVLPGAITEVSPLPVEIAVLEPGTEQPLRLRIETPPLRVESPRWMGIPRSRLLAFGLPVLLLAATAIVGFRVRRARARRAEQAEAEATHGAGPPDEALLSGLRRARVRGDTVSFLQEALAVQSRCADPDGPQGRALRSLLEEARYAGRSLSGEAMERWVQDLERSVSRTAAAPAPGPPERKP